MRSINQPPATTSASAPRVKTSESMLLSRIVGGLDCATRGTTWESSEMPMLLSAPTVNFFLFRPPAGLRRRRAFTFCATGSLQRRRRAQHFLDRGEPFGHAQRAGQAQRPHAVGHGLPPERDHVRLLGDLALEGLGHAEQFVKTHAA